MPFKCVAESIKTNLPILNRHYFIVTPNEASLITNDDIEPAISLEEGVHHVNAPVTNSKDSILYKTLD